MVAEMDRSNRIAQKLSALAAMGFQRADASPIPTETIPVAGNRHKVTMVRPSMGTLVSVTAIHDSLDLAEEAMGRAFGEMDRVVELLNRYDPNSALSYLNDGGSLEGPPQELATVLGRALGFFRASQGVFDPTVQPLIDLFRAGRQGPLTDPDGSNLPPRQDVLELLDLVDADAVEFSPSSIRLGKEGMGITLDGIAKGYVVDRVAEILSEHGLDDYLINAGGDIRGSGHREDGEAWRVAVQSPNKDHGFPEVIPLPTRAVATSGSYEIYFDPDRKHHHIIDSRDGTSPQQFQSVSVVAPTAMEADALATSVFLMEPDRGVAFIDSIPECACLILDRHGRQVRSARWRSAAEPPTIKAETL